MFRLITFLIVLTVPGLAAMAQDANIPMAVPTSGWLVGPAIPMINDDSVPCVMFNRYDSGYGVRVSGDDQKIFALAIDFRQAVFTPEETYGIVLSLPPDFSTSVAAQAHDVSTLLINSAGLDGFYKSFSQASVLRLQIDEAALDFSLLGVRDGLKRLAACASSKTTGAAEEEMQEQQSAGSNDMIERESVTGGQEEGVNSVPVDHLLEAIGRVKNFSAE